MNGQALETLINAMGEHQGMRAYITLCEAGFKIERTTMTDQTHLDAAQGLIKRLNAPAQVHSVWVQAETETDAEGITRATGKQQLCVSIRPEWADRVTVPSSHAGIPVVNVPWPKGN